MKLQTSLRFRLIRLVLAVSAPFVCVSSQVAHAQSASSPASTQGAQLQRSLQQSNSKDSKPSLPGDPGQVQGNDVLQPMTIEQQKAEARKKSELVDLQKEAYEHAVENMLEAVDE
jgi:hypothetical protein